MTISIRMTDISLVSLSLGRGTQSVTELIGKVRHDSKSH